MPETIIIYFEKYIGPQFFSEHEKKNWIPLTARSQFAKCINSTRKQFPLRLAYAITTHKTQGETLDKGIIDLGKSEKNLGTTFTQISRFRKLTDFLIKPFSFTRLQVIANSTVLSKRVLEEKRLNELNIKTKTVFEFLL